MRFTSSVFSALLSLTLVASAQTGFHSESYPAPGDTMITADFNGDGAPDLLFFGNRNAVMLNNGDGAFGAAQNVDSTGAAAAAVGDINGDGKPDIALCLVDSSGNYSLAVFQNEGDGNFHQVWTNSYEGHCTGVAIGDANKDGKADLVVTGYTGISSPPRHNSISTYPGDGSGNFGAPIVQANLHLDGNLFQGISSTPDQCWIGEAVGTDFTGDGILDLVIPADCYVDPTTGGTLWFAKGDGTGHYKLSEIKEGLLGFDYNYPRLVDANHDGKMDVAMVDYQWGPHGSFNGHSALLLNEGKGVMKYVQTFDQNAYAGYGGYVNAASGADFNNDGRADTVAGFTQQSVNSNNPTYHINIVEAKPGGGYAQSERWSVPENVTDILAADFDQNGSPDIAVIEQAPNFGAKRLVIYLNDKSGSSSCLAPGSPGAVLCTPQPGKTYPSPVLFTAAGTGASGKVDHLELWIDGQKIDNYPGNTLSTHVKLAKGSHTAAVVEVDSNYNYIKSGPVDFKVGSGGGGSCTAPSSPGAVLCSPTQGSTVTLPVTFTGKGTAATGKVDHLELWLDGKKFGDYPGASINITANLPSGKHMAGLVEVDSKYHTVKSGPVDFTVR